jgi:hypothetical protein
MVLFIYLFIYIYTAQIPKWLAQMRQTHNRKHNQEVQKREKEIEKKIYPLSQRVTKHCQLMT